MAVQCKTIGITSEDIQTYKHFRKSFAVSKVQTADVSRYFKYKAPNEVARGLCCATSPKLELHKNVQTQTDYRESEAQTDPWEPPYRVVPDHNPEILTLTHLTWEHGLPAGVHEVHVINRMQTRRSWEAILPPMDTPANIKLRASIITALEIDEWAFRESEIQFVMDLRMNLMRSLLRSRESERGMKAQGRFSRLQETLGKRRDDKVKNIRHNLKRDLRKLRKKYRDQRKPDIIEQHVDLKSELYAPQMRFGEHPQRQHETLQELFPGESFVEQEEERDTLWLPSIEDSKANKLRLRPVDICIRETRWTEEKLKQLHSDLKAIRMNVKPDAVDVIPTLVKRKSKPPPLPVTPRRADVWDSKEKEWEESAIFIQKLVRGRAIQYLMHEGRDRCRELIEELQSAQEFDRQRQEERRDDEARIIDLPDDQSIRDDRLREILNSLEGKTISGILDFLSKELVRLEDERRAHAFALLAERERNMREAVEAGRRQLERNRRREFDEMFKQIVKVNQDSVEAYLEDIIREGIEWISNKTAKEHVSDLCDKADANSQRTVENANKLAEEELVADMIYNFVLPNVEKHNMRKKIRDHQQSYMQNAYTTVYEKLLDLLSITPTRATDQEVCIKNEDMQTICVADTNIEGDEEQDIEIEETESLVHETDADD